MPQTLLEMAKDLILAQIQAQQLSPEGMHAALQQTYASLLALHTQEDASSSVAVAIPEIHPQPIHWRRSITHLTVTCLVCHARFKQLSASHLRKHGLDSRSYRQRYRIPPRQPLAARIVSAHHKQLAKQSRPWEKTPMYRKAHRKAQQPEGKKTGRRKAPESETARVGLNIEKLSPGAS